MGFDLSILGVTENIPRVNFMEYTGLIQAPPKWGKTTIASLYPNCVLAAVEPGFKAKRINYVDTSTWVKFRSFIDKLEQNRKAIGTSVQTIAIDTVDRLYPECQAYIVEQYNKNPRTKYKVKTIGDIPHGKGWGMADNEFLEQINKILSMQFTILFLTHNKIKTITPEEGEQYDVYVPTMHQRCADLIFPLVDFIINGEKTVEVIDGKKYNKRLMRLQGNNMSDSGNRLGSMDEVIKFDTEEEAIAKFKESFKRGIEENIRNSGITKSIEDIEKEQNKQREEELNEYLENVKTKQEKVETPEPTPEERLENAIKAIDDLVNNIKEKGVGKDKIAETIKKYVTSKNKPSANYNSIKDIDVATNVYKALKELEGK